MSTTDITTGLAGMTSSVIANYNNITGPNGALSNDEAANLVAQTMAGGTSIFAGLKGTGNNPGATALAVTWNTTATLTATTVLNDDKTQYNKDLAASSSNTVLEADQNKILGDYVQIAGDLVSGAGAIIGQFGGAESKIGSALSAAGVALTGLGISLDNNINFAAYSAAVQKTVNNYVNNADTLLSEVNTNASDF